MLILVPPSEGKSSPEAGPRLDLSDLAYPGLGQARSTVLRALVDLCRDHPERAAAALGLGPRQAGEVIANAALLTRPCAPAIEVYTGVLYDGLDYGSLDAAARRRARSSIAIASGLWGLVRPGDLIPAYRLSASVNLPGVGTLASLWREPISEVLSATRGVIVDLRSSAYVALGPVPAGVAPRCVIVRVLHEHRGRRTVVSHHNKATKGRIVRSLLQQPRLPRSPDALIESLAASGHRVEPAQAQDGSTLIDVIVREV